MPAHYPLWRPRLPMTSTRECEWAIVAERRAFAQTYLGKPQGGVPANTLRAMPALAAPLISLAIVVLVAAQPILSKLDSH